MSDLFIGLLSGTSMDGIDAALVRFGPRPELVATHAQPFPEELRREMLALAVPGENEIDRLGVVDAQLGKAFAHAVRALLQEARVDASQVRAIGSHGQTIRHRPTLKPGFTLQIGDPNVIAAETGIPVVADFRRKDMALGGQGAPLVPAFHDAVFRSAEKDRVVVNIGGIANITVLPADPAGSVAGFDTGPGNTLLDQWARRMLSRPMDRDGAFAARGTVDAALLNRFLEDRYFAQPPPKSTGPEYFTRDWLDRKLGPAPRAGEDVQATLLELTARSIADGVRKFTSLSAPDVFVCGGGARNGALMRALQRQFAGQTVATTERLGVAVDWVEAMAFAWLARERIERRPGNCPRVTGAARGAVLGGLYLPD